MSTKTTGNAVAVKEGGKAEILAMTQGEFMDAMLNAPMNPIMAAFAADIMLRAVDYTNPQAGKALNNDYGAQLATFQAGEIIDHKDIKKSGKTVETLTKLRKLVVQYQIVATTLAAQAK